MLGIGVGEGGDASAIRGSHVDKFITLAMHTIQPIDVAAGHELPKLSGHWCVLPSKITIVLSFVIPHIFRSHKERGGKVQAKHQQGYKLHVDLDPAERRGGKRVMCPPS